MSGVEPYLRRREREQAEIYPKAQAPDTPNTAEYARERAQRWQARYDEALDMAARWQQQYVDMRKERDEALTALEKASTPYVPTHRKEPRGWKPDPRKDYQPKHRRDIEDG